MTDQQDSPQLIPPHGGYRDLKSYEMAEIFPDTTVVFCDRCTTAGSRTHDRIVQAARSGQNLKSCCWRRS
jgi:restriction system protein